MSSLDYHLSLIALIISCQLDIKALRVYIILVTSDLKKEWDTVVIETEHVFLSCSVSYSLVNLVHRPDRIYYDFILKNIIRKPVLDV